MDLDKIIKKIKSRKKNAQIVILPRNNEEANQLKEKYGKKIIIPKRAVDGPSLVSYSDLVISGSGTMNREAVVLGIPVISTYPHNLLAADKFFVKNKHMLHDRVGEFKKIKNPFKKLKRYRKKNNGIRCLLDVVDSVLQN